MGVRGLFTYCNPIRKKANMNLTGLHIGIDGFSLFFLFREDRAAFKRYIEKVKACGTLTVVIDKRAAKEKREVVQERKELRKEAKAEAISLTSFTQTPEYEELDEEFQAVLDRVIAQKERAAWCLYPEYMKWFLEMLNTLDIPYTWAKEEADSVLANDTYDVVISSDSDLLILGCRCLWLPRTDGNHGEINGEEFRRFIGLNGEQLFQMAYLAGCDVQPRSLMSLKEAVSRLRFYGSIYSIHRKHPEIVSIQELENYEKIKNVWIQ